VVDLLGGGNVGQKTPWLERGSTEGKKVRKRGGELSKNSRPRGGSNLFTHIPCGVGQDRRSWTSAREKQSDKRSNQTARIDVHYGQWCSTHRKTAEKKPKIRVGEKGEKKKSLGGNGLNKRREGSKKRRVATELQYRISKKWRLSYQKRQFSHKGEKEETETQQLQGKKVQGEKRARLVQNTTVYRPIQKRE